MLLDKGANNIEEVFNIIDQDYLEYSSIDRTKAILERYSKIRKRKLLKTLDELRVQQDLVQIISEM